MPILSISGVKAFDDLTTQTIVYSVYAAAVIVILIWLIFSFSNSRGLINHRNAVCLRSLVNFLRTTEKTGNQVNRLFEILTKNKNDIAMLFHMYCRIHSDFSSIEQYMNYKTYKKINNKQKPWGATLVVIVVLLIAAVFSISYFVGLQAFLKMDFKIANLLKALAVPLGLMIVWLLLLNLILIKYKMYWVEFENLFRKVSAMCGSFFASQEEYYAEFSENMLGLVPIGGVKRRIERIIATTDPEAIEGRKPYKVLPSRKQEKSEISERKPAPVALSAPAAAAVNSAADQKGFSQQMPPSIMPTMPGVRVLKPHPETEAYLQAQSQITTQLMQMMMQQSMQQSQVMQRALTSQQALANSVVQQNIMAMRLEAQQASLLRPDLAKRIAEQTYVWPTNKSIPEKEPEETIVADAKRDTKEEKVIVEISPDEVEVSHDEVVQKNAAEKVAEVKPKDEKTVMLEKLREAFDLLSAPPDANKEPDPVFLEPKRDLTNVEKRLAQFFTAKVYMYD